MVTLSLKKWGFIFIVVFLLFLSSDRVFAHAYLERSDPADNAILDEPPAQFQLWFSEPISPQFSNAQMLDINGSNINIQNILFDPGDPNLMILDLPPELSEGVYSIHWQVLSTADGHSTQGLVVFGIGSDANLSEATAVETATAVPPPEIILRWLNYGFLLVLVGAIAIVYLVLDPSQYPLSVATVHSIVRLRILRLAIWCALILFLWSFAWLAWQTTTLTQTMANSVPETAVVRNWLFDTRLGILWLARQLVLLLVGICLYSIFRTSVTGDYPRTKLLKPLLAILLCVLLFIQSLSSHAAALSRESSLAITADVLHLLGASFWMGGLISLTIGLMPLLVHYRSDFVILVKAGWQPFGKFAAIGVGLIIATGIYGLGRQVASVDALITTPYGQTLILKTTFFLFVGFLGLLNSLILQPRIVTPLGKLLRKPLNWTPLSLRKVPFLILIELSLGIVILLFTAYLTAAPTAQGQAFLPVEEIPQTQSMQVDDVVINLSVKPNKPGANVFTIRAQSTRRPAPAPIERLILRLAYLDQDYGLKSVDAELIEPGVYRFGGNDLNVAGNWQIEVIVRRLGFEDVVANFKWQVAASGSQNPEIISNVIWEPYLTVSSAIILILMVSLVVVIAGLKYMGRKERSAAMAKLEKAENPTQTSHST